VAECEDWENGEAASGEVIPGKKRNLIAEGAWPDILSSCADSFIYFPY
jgi:hypothetical protein